MSVSSVIPIGKIHLDPEQASLQTAVSVNLLLFLTLDPLNISEQGQKKVRKEMMMFFLAMWL